MEGLSDEDLKRAIREVRQGLTGNALGGSLFKKRVAIGSKGKSGGLRTILAYKAPTADIFCLYVFAKKERDNIDADELKALRQLAKVYLQMTEKEIVEAVERAVFLEVNEDAGDNKENEGDNEEDEEQSNSESG
jgi:hypothetical protein